MFKVKAKKDYKQFKAGAPGTVLHVLSDNNSQPLLLVANKKGEMTWCEAELFLYVEQACPVKHARGPNKKPAKKG